MPKILTWLTFSIFMLSGVASLCGLTITGLYRDNPFYSAAWQANDVVTALLAPALLVSFYYYREGKGSAQLVWLGLLLYMFYNYAFYLFGAAYNWFFLVYVALFTLSLYALLLGLREIIGTSLSKIYLPSLKRKLTATFLILVAVPVALVELSQCLRFIVSGAEPKIPQLVMALDLTLVIPNAILAAWLLVRKKPWGVVIATMMSVKSFSYGLVLVTSSASIAISGAGPWDRLWPFYIFVSAGGFIFTALMLKELVSATSK
jgi:hypothetical protein